MESNKVMTMSTYNSCEFCYKLEQRRGSSKGVIWSKKTVVYVYRLELPEHADVNDPIQREKLLLKEQEGH